MSVSWNGMTGMIRALAPQGHKEGIWFHDSDGYRGECECTDDLGGKHFSTERLLVKAFIRHQRRVKMERMSIKPQPPRGVDSTFTHAAGPDDDIMGETRWWMHICGEMRLFPASDPPPLGSSCGYCETHDTGYSPVNSDTSMVWTPVYVLNIHLKYWRNNADILKGRKLT